MICRAARDNHQRDAGSGRRGLSRRALLAGIAGAWSIVRPAAAKSPAEVNEAAKEPASVVEDIAAGKRGTTITLSLAHGMFPHPGAPWKDATTRVFVPSHFRVPADLRVDAVLHFHGHKTTAPVIRRP